MRVVIPTHAGDVDLAIDNAKLIHELGGCPGHQASVTASSNTPADKVQELAEILKGSFSSVDVYVAEINERQDPNDGANHIFTPQQNNLFKKTMERLKAIGNSGPFLYMEADTTPTAKGWLEEIDNAFTQAAAVGKKVLGGLIPLRVPKYALVPGKFGMVRSLMGVSADPKQPYIPAPVVLHAAFAEQFTVWRTCKLEPWDIKSRMELERFYCNTGLIFHAHNSTNFANGTYTRPESDTPGSINEIPEGVMLVHGCKDGSLAKLVRESLQEKAPVKTEETEKKAPEEKPKAKATKSDTADAARAAILEATK